jgi:hypothetical protein
VLRPRQPPSGLEKASATIQRATIFRQLDATGNVMRLIAAEGGGQTPAVARTNEQGRFRRDAADFDPIDDSRDLCDASLASAG